MKLNKRMKIAGNILKASTKKFNRLMLENN